jgi:hypothetical protein
VKRRHARAQGNGLADQFDAPGVVALLVAEYAQKV